MVYGTAAFLKITLRFFLRRISWREKLFVDILFFFSPAFSGQALNEKQTANGGTLYAFTQEQLHDLPLRRG
jgi:hypothetical protein